MRMLKTVRFLFGLACSVAFLAPANATSVLQMNLNQMTAGADTIVRGEVIEARQTSVEAGGGNLPAMYFKVRVSEALKGQVQTVKDAQVVEFKMLGKLKDYNANKAIYDGFPALRQGQEYLLFIGASSSVGLTTTMGLGQGCFHVVASSSGDMATNAFENAGLFKGMDVDPADGPVSYDTLRSLIQAKLGY